MRQIAQLLAEERERLALAVHDGAPAPSTYREAVHWLSARMYMRTIRYRSQQWHADTAGLDTDVAEFVQAFKRLMERCGIPVYSDVAFVPRQVHAAQYVMGVIHEPPWLVDYASRRAFSLVHAVRGRKLPPLAWEVFEHIGLEAAGKLGLGVQWGGSSSPWQWIVDP